MENALETVREWLSFFGPATDWILAILVIIVGYFIARLLEKLVRKGLSKTSIDDKLAKLLGQDCDGCEKGTAKFVFYLFMLFVVYVALNIAGQSEAVEPLREILSKILGFIPNLLGAGVIAFVGWIVATLVRNLLVGVLTASKVDERLGLGEKKPITTSLGIIAFFGIILLMLPPALSLLEMDEISQPIGEMVDTIFGYVPHLFSGLIIFAITYLIASIVQTVLANVLSSIGVDGLLQKLGYKGESLVAGKPLSLIISYIVMATILVTGSAQAIEAMQLDFISNLSAGFVDGFMNILGAVIIIFVGVYIANIVGQLIEPHSAFWAKAARIAILVFLGAAALQKANISSLTNETFQFAITATIIAAAFAAGVGGAIALGLGGRDRAKSILDKLKG